MTWRLESPPAPLTARTPGLTSGFDVSRASWEFPEGTCAGYNGYPSDLVSNGQKTDNNKNAAPDPAEIGQDQATKISFSAEGLGGSRTLWEAVLWQQRLYVSVSSAQLAEGSKRAFVSLLEYAEEELEVTHVVACLDRLHNDNKNVIRNFLFLGFQPIAPGHEFLPSNPNVVCFLYTI